MSDVVIIGSGLGGLLCGAILSKCGRTVTVLERGAQPGGCLQTFVREGLRFDTGFHSVAGLEQGGQLRRIFEPLGLMDLPWEYVPQTDEIVLNGVSRHLPQVSLPQADGLAADILGPDAPLLMGSAIRLSHPAGEVTMDEFTHVIKPFMKGAWRLPSGDLAVKHLCGLINGPVKTRCEVTGIEPGTVTCANGSSYSGIIISDIHPRKTFEMFRGHVRAAYLRRLEALEDGPGIFTVYCKLRPGAKKFQPWCTTYDSDLMIHYGNRDEDGYALTADLLTYAPGPVTNRKELARNLIGRIPGLEEAVEKFWTSTPATWERYTGTPGGSAYGIRKKDTSCYVHPRTPVPGLYLTGQNCGLHGILGVSETAIVTCREIVGEELLNKTMNL